ncbi:HAMP domain-containing histidine kinase [Micromonospora zingiberis]|uniref:histidine kinase n=1 Tax=Micromonospora zingiberis TaxID=2053011 RepID=A0A4V2LXH4_9ACTN|nr:HAMP domain-containing sensor histidine kinase [Micromonospora zingiberis]TCC00426.1 HAMP domain-containing histidine kinase [Micromonospora zingiberis]
MVRRLLVTYLSFALLILVALAVPLGYVYQRGEQQRVFGHLEHDAEVLAAFVDTALDQQQRDQIDLLAEESARRWNGEVDIVDGSGTLLATTRQDLPAAAALASAVNLSAVAGGRVSSGIRTSGGVPTMWVAVPIHPGKPDQGALLFSAPTGPMTARIHQFWSVLAGVAVVVLAAVAVVAVALARWFGRPVRELERATRRLADGQMSPTAPGGPPELRRLAATFNATATRLQELIAAHQSFVGHASHQLRTPLAALRLRLENLEPDIGAAGEANLRAALVETDRLARLVDTLLEMTRSAHPVQPGEPVGLAAVVATRIESWLPLAADRSVTLRVRGSEQEYAWALPGAVEQILDNLLANALVVAPCGSTVTVSWGPASDGGGVELRVTDAGPGLSAAQRTQAFEPFWRAPGAPSGGTGLGLALVRKLAVACGGSARLDATDGPGVAAVVSLPAAQCQESARARPEFGRGLSPLAPAARTPGRQQPIGVGSARAHGTAEVHPLGGQDA